MIWKDISEYDSFNELEISEVKRIEINGEKMNKKDSESLFLELKYDKFTWANHPIVIERDTVKIFTNTREYKFVIENTSNQGVLVIRINAKNSSYVTNRNDDLLKFLKNTNKYDSTHNSDDELYRVFDSVTKSPDGSDMAK